MWVYRGFERIIADHKGAFCRGVTNPPQAGFDTPATVSSRQVGEFNIGNNIL